MKNWIYLDKKGKDQYVQMLANGAGAACTLLETWRYEDSQDPLVIRGIMKHKIIKRCWQDNRQFRYMDSGYFGNRPSAANPNGWKYWHRIVPNNLQHGDIIARPADRWQRHGIKLRPRQNHGRNILIAAPDEKPCAFYGLTLDQWMRDTIDTIKQHTDRPIVVRQRPASRVDRKTQRAEDWLADVHALVTFNSNAATEAIMAGVPVFVTAPCNASSPVSNTDLTKIDDPWFADSDQIHQWACHLAYGQFHTEELVNGTAARILDETEEILNA
jgi:hypothetical protein